MEPYASIIGFRLGPTPGTPTGRQVLLLIIDTSFFPQTPGKWYYLFNRNFNPGFLTPGICQFCLMGRHGEIYIVFYFIRSSCLYQYTDQLFIAILLIKYKDASF
jgi:hypothetical protein